MVNSLLSEALQEHYKENLERYVREHPGEYILIEEGFIESFYKTKPEFEKEVDKKYGDSMSYTILGTRIPEKIQNNWLILETIALKTIIFGEEYGRRN